MNFTQRFPSLSERSAFLTYKEFLEYLKNSKLVSISFREKCLPDVETKYRTLRLQYTLFPSLSERSAFLTRTYEILYELSYRDVSISFREKCLPDKRSATENS